MDTNCRRIAFRVFLVAMSMVLGSSQLAEARDGDLFGAFGAQGRAQYAFTTSPLLPDLYIDVNGSFEAPVAVQPDGKIVIAGSVKTVAGDDIGVLRINADGSRDSSFGSTLNGQSIIAFDLGGSNNDHANAIALDAHGNVLVAGQVDTANAEDCAVVRLTPDGLLDTTFSADGRATIGFDLGPPGQDDDICTQIVVQHDGKILIVGQAQTGLVPGFAVPAYRIVAARLNANGTRDTTFNGDGKVDIDLGTGYLSTFALSMAEQSDGHIVIVGDVLLPSLDRLFAMARLNADGSLDSGFGNHGTLVFGPHASGYSHGDLTGVVPLPNGSIAVAGFVYDTIITEADYYFAQIRTDGSFDPAFGNGGDLVVPIDLGGDDTDLALALTRDSGGRLIANGIATTDTGEVMAFVRLTADGQPDSTFGSGGIQIASSTPPGAAVYGEVGGGVAIGAGDTVVAASLVNVDGSADFELGVVELVGDTIFSSGFTP